MQVSNDIYLKRYGETYYKQIKELERLITSNETGSDTFKVFNLEAGTGKSVQTANILNEYLTFAERKFLIVKKFNDDIHNLVEYLSDHKDMVLGITNENWGVVKNHINQLHKYHVVIISHERYKMLCKELSDYRPYFEEDRHTLVIDERVDLPTYKVEKKHKTELMELLHIKHLQNEVLHIFDRLDEIIQRYDTLPKGEVYKVDRFSLHPSTMQNFIEEVEDNKGRFTQAQYDDIKELINNIKGIYDSSLVYYNRKGHTGILTGHDTDYRVWGLKNNIILDATGGIDHIYKLNEKFQVTNQTRFINHEGSDLHIHQFKSSKSAVIEHKDQYFREVIERMKQSDNTKLLVIQKSLVPTLYQYLLMAGYKEKDILIHEDMNEDIEGKKIIINWYYNLIGRNYYAELKECWMLGTPNKQFADYIVDYVQYAEQPTYNRSKKFSNGVFVNKDFRKIQSSFLAKEMYQSIKRIARNDKPMADYHIVLNNPEVEKILIRMLKGINVHKHKFDFVLEMKETKDQQRQEQKTKTKKYLIYDFITSLDSGEYKKSWVCEELGIHNKTLPRYLNKRNNLFKPLIEGGQVQSKGQYILIFKS